MEFSPYLLLPLAYLVGATPTSFWVGRVFYGVDLRRHGSGNLGATNAFRLLGVKAAVSVIIIDVGKGFLPVALFPALAGPTVGSQWILAYGGAAIVGHVFSLWVGFRGGKGVATSAGVFLGLAPWALLGAFLAWLMAVLSTRIVSAGSLAAALALPLVVWLVPPEGGVPVQLFASALALFIVWSHRSNISRLMRGEEKRISRLTPGAPTEASSRAEGESP